MWEPDLAFEPLGFEVLVRKPSTFATTTRAARYHFLDLSFFGSLADAAAPSCRLIRFIQQQQPMVTARIL
jgi:hypothetical protein